MFERSWVQIPTLDGHEIFHIYIYIFFKKRANPGLFLFILVFSITIYRKIVDLSGIRTRIVGVEGEHADHLTTTTAHLYLLLKFYFSFEHTKIHEKEAGVGTFF